jgi:hypothetical protein
MAGRNEIYSGEDRFTFYTESRPSAWYDLRLFQELNTAAIQQVEVNFTDLETYVLRRSGAGWIIRGNESATVDNTRVDAWLRSTLEAEAGDFGIEAPAEIDGNITFWLGDGTTRTLIVGPADEQQSRLAMVADSSLVYVLPEWAINRLFRESSHFLRAGL